jgi:putative ABC transport system ATP-binding protein
VIVVIGTDGKVAETGKYSDLSADPESAFSKLMEWQLSGDGAAMKATKPRPTNQEEIEYDLEKMEEEGEHENEHDEHEHEERTEERKADKVDRQS